MEAIFLSIGDSAHYLVPKVTKKCHTSPAARLSSPGCLFSSPSTFTNLNSNFTGLTKSLEYMVAQDSKQHMKLLLGLFRYSVLNQQEIIFSVPIPLKKVLRKIAKPDLPYDLSDAKEKGHGRKQLINLNHYGNH